MIKYGMFLLSHYYKYNGWHEEVGEVISPICYYLLTGHDYKNILLYIAPF